MYTSDDVGPGREFISHLTLRRTRTTKISNWENITPS